MAKLCTIKERLQNLKKCYWKLEIDLIEGAYENLVADLERSRQQVNELEESIKILENRCQVEATSSSQLARYQRRMRRNEVPKGVANVLLFFFFIERLIMWLKIFTSHILNALKLNKNNNPYSIANVDDLTIYVAAKYPRIIKELLKSPKNKRNNYYVRWNLRVNPGKYITIVFRKPARFITKAKEISNDNFAIELTTLKQGRKLWHQPRAWWNAWA